MQCLNSQPPVSAHQTPQTKRLQPVQKGDFSPYARVIGPILTKLGLALAPVLLTLPALSAERIYINYGPWEFGLSVRALEVLAKEGEVADELATYARFFSSEQLEQLRELLLTRADITPVAVAQFLYSPQGEAILEQVGEIVQTRARQSGFYAIRAALILAAADEEGFTPLNILKQFPTHGIQLNSTRGFEIIDQLASIVDQTDYAIAQVEQQSLQEAAAAAGVKFSGQSDLRQPGPVSFTKTSLMLRDQQRERTFPVDLYLPQRSTPRRTPVVVISHGLGSDRTTFEYLATHLATHGFAVAVPEHPGSNADQIQALLNGLASNVTPPQELIDRPLDIQFLLDELERSYADQLNVEQVGIIGQSYGGYTSLVLAGAEFNLETLLQECQPSNDVLNLSLLLQCQALRLPQTDYQLRDARITAAIAINPLTSVIFGETQLSQIQVPLMLISCSADKVTPALQEQIRPFTWLATPDKYLALLRKATHFSTLAESAEGVALPPEALGPDPTLAQSYVKALSLAFLATYINHSTKYQPYLSARYAQVISRDAMPLSLVQLLPPEQLQKDPNRKTSSLSR